MRATFESLDYSPWAGRLVGMVTLTYPGDWLSVCPDGATLKRHWDNFSKAWRRRWPLMAGIWKMEFQSRWLRDGFGQYARDEAGNRVRDPAGRAPHIHFWTCSPVEDGGDWTEFTHWLSVTWARIVGAAGDERMRHERAGTAWDTRLNGRDPRAIALYMAKEGAASAKSYQHILPAQWDSTGHGRWWGVVGLQKAQVEVTLTREESYAVSRALRQLARSKVGAVRPREPSGPIGDKTMAGPGCFVRGVWVEGVESSRVVYGLR